MMKRLGFEDLHVDYIVVDTIRVPRATFGAIIAAWRDGYGSWRDGARSGRMRGLFDYVVDAIHDPEQPSSGTSRSSAAERESG